MIVSAAIKLSCGLILSLPKPNRHHHVLHMGSSLDLDMLSPKQGFLDSDGRFMDRYEAGIHAIECGQIEKLRWPENLFSEDLR